MDSLHARVAASPPAADEQAQWHSVVAGGAEGQPCAGPWLVFEISDTGNGIAPNSLASLFKQYEQVCGNCLQVLAHTDCVTPGHGGGAAAAEETWWHGSWLVHLQQASVGAGGTGTCCPSQ